MMPNNSVNVIMVTSVLVFGYPWWQNCFMQRRGGGIFLKLPWQVGCYTYTLVAARNLIKMCQ